MYVYVNGRIPGIFKFTRILLGNTTKFQVTNECLVLDSQVVHQIAYRGQSGKRILKKLTSLSSLKKMSSRASKSHNVFLPRTVNTHYNSAFVVNKG